MDTFSENMLAKIKTRPECQSCPLFGKPVVLYEKLYTGDGNCDVLFMGINPGKQEAIEGRPFCGPAGKKLRAYLKQTGLDKYNIAFTNCILCSTHNEREIPNVEQCINNCRPLARQIAAHLKPRLYVPVGRNCAQYLFKMEGSITQISGQLFKDQIIPIIHPASLLYNPSGENAEIFEKSLNNIKIFLESGDQKTSQ